MNLMRLATLAVLLCGQAYGFLPPKGIALEHPHFGNFVEPFKIRFYYVQGGQIVQRICIDRSKASEIKNLEECRVVTKVSLREFQNYLDENNYFMKTVIPEASVDIKGSWSTYLKKEYKNTPEYQAFEANLLSQTENLSEKLHEFFWEKSLQLKEENKLSGFFSTLRSSAFEGTYRQLVVTGNPNSRIHWAKVAYNSKKQNDGSKLIIKKIDDPDDLFTCSAIFGPDWREPTFDEIEKNYDTLYETELRYHLEDQTFWLADNSVSSGIESKAIFSFTKHRWFQRLNRKMEMTKLPNAAHRLCLCDQAQCI
ncbi:MAG: hypothetical protein JNM93_07890 [Bacteriovoracaceae bacterium]|nr:hypothetical protein [Bacteriovoracaceae bacterium]